MSKIAQARRESRRRRHRRVRKKIHGTAARPRLAVYRSNKHLTVQVIDDDAGRTLAAASTTPMTEVAQVKSPANTTMNMITLLVTDASTNRWRKSFQEMERKTNTATNRLFMKYSPKRSVPKAFV